ncbi:MAG: ABC transporter permease subunit [Clostridia bacterium]|nr:ABC transporter permease subunit [Clostridia bacterium]
MKRLQLRAVLGWLAVAAVWLTVWLIAARAVNLELLLPSPGQVLARLGELAAGADFWRATAASLGRVMLGTIAALVIGVLLAVGGALCPPIRRLFLPLLGIIKSTPVASFILLALVWLERDILPAFMAALIVLPVIWGNLDTGIAAVGRDLRELAAVYRLPLARRLKRIYMPAVMPYFVSCCRTSLGMAWKAGIAAEVLCIPPNSIGSRLNDAKVYLETTDLFAWTLTVILLSLLIEYLLMAALSRASRTWNTAAATPAGL